jgi:hypothetical protein
MFRHVSTRSAMSVHVLLCHYMFSYDSKCSAMSLHVLLCHYMFSYDSKCSVMSVHVLLCHYMFSYDSKCFAMSAHILPYHYTFCLPSLKHNVSFKCRWSDLQHNILRYTQLEQLRTTASSTFMCVQGHGMIPRSNCLLQAGVEMALQNWLDQRSSTWDTRNPVEREDIVRARRKHLTSVKTKRRNILNLEPALILAVTKIRPRIGVLACQKQPQSSH